MKTSIFKQISLWLPVVCTTIMLAACSNDDSSPQRVPQLEEKTIFYTATVGDDTRATVDDDNKRNIYFATGDKLYVQGTKISGVLDIQSGAGTDHATFEGTLTYNGSGSPADDLVLNATLVGSSNAGVQFADGKVTGIDYSTAICVADGPSSAVNEAVKKYSYLTGSSTFGAHSFTLTQHTAFLNFTIKVPGTAPGTPCAVSVAGVGGGTGSVTSEMSGDDVVLKFVAPVATQTLSSASVMVKNQYGIPFGGTTTLTARVYNISKTIDVNHEYVDLGLPNGVKWAKTNLGATTETGYGDFYAWGGTTGHSTTDTYTFTQADAPYYSGSAYTKYTTANVNLEASDDAATQSRGKAWRMPTKEEFDNLINGSYTTCEWKSDYNGVTGYLITSKIEGYTSNKIFLPASGKKTPSTTAGTATDQNIFGNYWLSTLSSTTTAGYCFAFGSGEVIHSNNIDRSTGMTIRPVYKP